MRQDLFPQQENVLNFPTNKRLSFSLEAKKDTPKTDEMILQHDKLNSLSSYKSNFDWEPIRKLELRNLKNPIRGGFVFKSPFRLANAHYTCQQCLYSFEIDTYGRGCVHNCVYCYAKAELTVHGMWNMPYPAPVNINEIRKVFYTVFETSKKNKWRDILTKRIPLRIGSMSDSFMFMDDKIKVTKELLNILNYYKYPYLIFTRSDLIAREDYLNLIDPNLSSVQFSISSTNDDLNKKIEPGAPSAKRRLKALETLAKAKRYTTVRINPLFPIYPDGYFTDPQFKWDGPVPQFDYFNFNMIEEIASAGVPAVLVGMGRFSSFSMNQIQKATGFNLRTLYKTDPTIKKSSRDFHFSPKETRYYYEKIKWLCNKNNIQFTTCYIGNGEKDFWRNQDIWSNKTDCCNVKTKIEAFKTDCREIPFETRLKFSSNKSAKPVVADTLHKSLGDQLRPSKSDNKLIKSKPENNEANL